MNFYEIWLKSDRLIDNNIGWIHVFLVNVPGSMFSGNRVGRHVYSLGACYFRLF